MYPMKQITYHLPMKYWKMLETVPIKESCPLFDGHTSTQDVLKCLEGWLTFPLKSEEDQVAAMKEWAEQH